MSVTKEQIGELIEKIRLLEFILTSVNVVHAEHKAKQDQLFKDVSEHKLKLVEELVRVARVELTPLSVVNTLPPDAA